MKLSQQQLSVLKLRAAGLSIKEIAGYLQRSPKTVEYHYARMTHRLGIYDVALLTHFAIAHGIVDLRQDSGALEVEAVAELQGQENYLSTLE